MKIALVCPASLPASQFGGILFLTVNLAKKFSKMQHETTIFTTDLDYSNNLKTFNKNLPSTEIISGFKINRSHCWFSVYLYFVSPGMYNRLLNYKPDIIHTVGLRSFQSFIAALVSKKSNIPLVVSDQSGLFTHPELKEANLFKRILYRIQIPIINMIVKQSSRIIVGNEYEKEIFSRFNVDSKIKIVHNGIDLDILKVDSTSFKEKYRVGGRYILFVGRFTKTKGIDILLNAIALIKDKLQMKNTKLVIMGVEQDFGKQMKNLIKKLELENYILLIEKPERSDVISAYKECEFLVLPSRWELSPLVPLEAFAFKKPAIGSNTHGIPYTIKHNENGLLTEPEDHKQLAEAIFDLLENEKKRILFGEAGYNLVTNTCNSEEMANKTLKIYQEII